jgi:hypothetical protein
MSFILCESTMAVVKDPAKTIARMPPPVGNSGATVIGNVASSSVGIAGMPVPARNTCTV